MPKPIFCEVSGFGIRIYGIGEYSSPFSLIASNPYLMQLELQIQQSAYIVQDIEQYNVV